MLTGDLKRTPLYETHTSLNGRMVPFAGWGMPLQYTGILAETKAVRSKAGIFDVSHMGRLHITGPDANHLMDWIITSDASSLRQGRARYAMICNEEGGIIDDTVFYRLGEDHYLLVCNAANRQYVVPWMSRWAAERFPEAFIEDRTESTAMVAFQGPATPELLAGISDVEPPSILFFGALKGTVAAKTALIGRTGYTGEDGFELILEAEDAPDVWQALMGQGATPCGLGSRDVLRLEAGLALHGHDIDTSTTPLEAGLERFVRLDKEFVGAASLRRQKEEGPNSRLVGLVVHGRTIAREGHAIFQDATQVGRVTSGTHSPTLDRSIAMGYVTSASALPGNRLLVDIRGKLIEVEVVPLPFYARGATP